MDFPAYLNQVDASEKRTFSVLIVDDEKLVRDGLHRHFPWSKYDMEVVGEAGDGREACAFLQDHHVDLVITDVCMKQMSGIELARYLSENCPWIKVIFISGYDDLDYLKDALKLDAVDYILKAIDFNELGDTLNRVKKKMEDERKLDERIQKLEAQLKQSMPLLRERLLVQLIRDDVIGDSEIEGRFSFLGIQLSEENQYRLAVLRFTDFYVKHTDITEQARYLLCMQIQNALQDKLSEVPEGLFFASAEDEWVIVIPDNEQQDINHLLQDVVSGLNEASGLHARISLSPSFYGYTGMKEAYENTVRQLIEGNQASLMITTVKKYIEDNFQHDIALADIAASVYLTPSYVSGLFKSQTGITIRDYIAQLRITHAKELLKDPRVRLYDVGNMIGIESSSYFTRLFKKQTGMTPTEYRRTCAGNDLNGDEP